MVLIANQRTHAGSLPAHDPLNTIIFLWIRMISHISAGRTLEKYQKVATTTSTVSSSVAYSITVIKYTCIEETFGCFLFDFAIRLAWLKHILGLIY